ncbi:MAG TPA: hypothetical protein DDW42_02465 [Desulfobacteraceae bacterium]|nr:hypothetical protein [Desulfobacteraceae bacterium]
MVIISSYFDGETYGLLGPQMAATVIQENTPYDCIVIAVAREDDKRLIKKALMDHFGGKRPVIGFSTLSGREDLFRLAKDLKHEGAITILAGPQADVDYSGEKEWRDHLHRFRGLAANFSFSMHGPAEQAIPLLKNLEGEKWQDTPGLLSMREDGETIQNPKITWNKRFLGKVRWDNIYKIGGRGFTPLNIDTGQVLQHIGCPYAARRRRVGVDYPVSLDGKGGQKVILSLKGCSFCDVAVDKGFWGALSMETVLDQIDCLPNAEDGKKIPFELINENPLPGLSRLLVEVSNRGIGLSQINLILRADWFLNGEKHLREALHLAGDMGTRIVVTSMGFESFDNRILKNLNKGLDVETNVNAIRLMRRVKEEFPDQWGYSRVEGAIHGFIHPTPWDTQETSENIQEVIARYALAPDILPDHSIPLIIHHASGLGKWIRELERREKIRFERHVTIIGWWQQGDRFTL